MASKDSDIAERGEIFFFYRPRVGTEHPEGEEDVQRFHVVLRPEKGHSKIRLLTIGRKHLPDVREHERAWGFVDKIAASAEEIGKELQEQTYATKTRGQRHRPAARPAGKGLYVLVHHGRKLFLAYELDQPSAHEGPVQKELNIAPCASFALSVKNPERGTPPGVGLREQDEADYPRQVQAEFHGRRFATEDVHLLDYEGAEFILIGARESAESELEVDLERDKHLTNALEVLHRFRLDHADTPAEPLLKGEWR